MDNITRIVEWLRVAGVSYEYKEHPAAYTMQDIEQHGVSQGGLVCKNLFLRDSQKGKRHYLVTVCGDKAVDLKQLGAQLGDRLSFASAERLKKYVNLPEGAVTPLGVLFDTENAVQLALDKDLLQHEKVGVHPGENTATVFLNPKDLVALVEEQGHRVKWVDV